MFLLCKPRVAGSNPAVPLLLLKERRYLDIAGNNLESDIRV